MMDTIAGLTALEKFYAACALLGGIMFAARVVLQFVGGMAGGDVGAGVDGAGGDVGGMAGDAHAAASDHSFAVLSFQGLTAFFMMFGLVGLAVLRQTDLGVIASLIAGLAAGAVTVWLIGRIFMGMRRLQSDGTLNLSHTVGQEGTVYLRIPADGTGKVQIGVQGRLQIFDAVSAAKVPLASGERVRVASVVSGNIMVVEKL